MGGGLFGVEKPSPCVVGYAIDVADQPDTHVVGQQLRKLSLDSPSDQVHERVDLLLRAIPVLGRERIEGKILDADIGRKFGGAVHGRDPLGVACASGFPPEVGPAAVAIHNNGHMARDPVHVDIFKQCIEIHM